MMQMTMDRKSRDSLTIAVALSYAIAAVERLPKEWQEPVELRNMKDLMLRLIPDDNFRAQFIEIAQSVLSGEGKPFERPKLV